MKKAVVLALAAFFATAWVTPALAGEFSYGGYMRYRYVGGNPGTALFGFAEEDSAVNIWEYRIRQYFNYAVNDHVSTNVKFEWNPIFGQQGGFGGANGDLQVPSESELRIKNAYVRFDVPDTPITLTVGQQDFSTPKAIISVEDSTGIKASFAAMGGTHTLFWARPRAGGNFQTGADDGDWFGFVPTFKSGDISISPHVSYVTTGANIATASLQNAEIFFVGVDLAGKLGAIGFTADVVYQTGERTVAGTDRDLASFVVDVGATLNAGPGALTLKALYSPGDDNAADTDDDQWVNVISTDIGFSPFFHDGTSVFNYVGSTQPGVANGGVMAVGAEFAFSPVANVTLTPNVYYLKAAEDIITAAGNAEDFYGIEAGVQANWKVWDAVTILGQLDYLSVGDVFENAAGDTKDAWRVVVGPSLSW